MANNVKFIKDDFQNSNITDEEIAAAQERANSGWANANPTGTPLISQQKPTFARSEFDNIADWNDFNRAYTRAWDRANPSDGTGINTELTNKIATGEITGKDISNNYYALAAQNMDKAEAMGDFQYDFNKDPMFQMLSQSYMQQARNAANDASALAATRTGGYGNSYGAVAAGQQYNDALQNLYDNIPELEEAAYNRYKNQRDDYYARTGYYNDLGDTNYERYTTEEAEQYTRDYNAAVEAAELGEYGPLEDLLGINLDVARSNDTLNKVLSIIQAYDGDITSAGSLIQEIINQGLGTKKTNTTTATPATDASQGTTTTEKKTYNPTESAGTLTYKGKEILLPPSETMTGTYEYYIAGNGQLMFKYTDPSGQVHDNPYTGLLIGTDGTVVQKNMGIGNPYLPSYPSSILQTIKGADGNSIVQGANTGDPVLDALWNSADPAVTEALTNAVGSATTPEKSYVLRDEGYSNNGWEKYFDNDSGTEYNDYNDYENNYNYTGGNTGGGSTYTYTGGGNTGNGSKIDTTTALPKVYDIDLDTWDRLNGKK